MKLIIEIPDNVVTAIQNGEDYRYDIHTAIAQGTPYNPSGDLKPTSELINDIVGFDMSKIKMPKLPEYKESEK